ncbi:ATP-binding protein [Bacteroides faecichinchillae]|uniref:sensor histidine kinase n=1 Tax=Bacteroides faecichinchillae TaxID=871325 RepID=UPI003512EF9D
MSRFLIVILFIGLFHLELFSATGKVLVVSSYGTDYQWSNTIMDAIGNRLKEVYPSIEFSREFLSSEMQDESYTWGKKMGVLLSNYQRNPPRAIVLVSDEAWMGYQDVNVAEFKDVPLILCAVKPHSISTSDFAAKRDSLTLDDFTPTIEMMKPYKATAVLREMNTSGYLSLMDNLIVGLNRFVFITDSRFYGVYTHLLLQQEAERSYPQIPVQNIDGRFINTDSLLSLLPTIPSTAGVLLTSWLTGEYGFEYSKDYLYSRMENKLSTPIFITNNIGLDKEFFIGGYLNKASFWGNKAADLLLAVLGGTVPEKIVPEIYHDDQCHIAWKVFHHYDLNPEKLPAKVKYYNAPQAFWVEYKYYIIAVIGIFMIFLLFYIYTLRSNIKLQYANDKLKQAQEDLIIALRKAEESDRLKSAFLANMSHEIRTPLNAIVGFSGVLDEVDTKEERDEYVELIRRNSDLLLQLLSDILDLSRIEAGVLEFSFSQTDAFYVCNNVVTSLASKCRSGVELYLNVSVTSMPLTTDVNRLMQVLINLVNNAIKFTSKGSIEVGYFSYDDELVEFYVKDTGIGIATEKQAAIFGRFNKLNSYVEGTGLGLSICQTIVSMLGGKMGVESEEGVGSRFWFRIRKIQTNANVDSGIYVE